MQTELVVVVGACGGVGASTLAALLARERSAGGVRTGLVDLSSTGGGVEVVLGTEDVPGARWADLAELRGSVTATDLDGVLPVWGAVEVLGGDRRGGVAAASPDAVTAVLPALRERCASTVVDLPAAVLAAPEPWTAELLSARDDLLLVVAQDVRGVAAGLSLRPALERGPAQLVLRRRPRPRVSPLEAAHLLDLPLLAMLPEDRAVGESSDRGFGPRTAPRSRLSRAVRALARGAGRG